MTGRLGNVPGHTMGHWEDPSSSSTWDACRAEQNPSCVPLHPPASHHPCSPRRCDALPCQPCSCVHACAGTSARACCKVLYPAREACACACACVCVCVYQEACLHMKVAVCSGGLYHLLYDLIWRVPQPPFPTLCMLCCQGPGLSLSALPGLSRQAVIP